MDVRVKVLEALVRSYGPIPIEITINTYNAESQTAIVCFWPPTEWTDGKVLHIEEPLAPTFDGTLNNHGSVSSILVDGITAEAVLGSCYFWEGKWHQRRRLIWRRRRDGMRVLSSPETMGVEDR